ncbi:hypothetical protein BD309DRAFT_1043577, partial [Dichomitus squalens]
LSLVTRRSELQAGTKNRRFPSSLTSGGFTPVTPPSVTDVTFPLVTQLPFARLEEHPSGWGALFDDDNDNDNNGYAPFECDSDRLLDVSEWGLIKAALEDPAHPFTLQHLSHAQAPNPTSFRNIHLPPVWLPSHPFAEYVLEHFVGCIGVVLQQCFG